MNSDVFANATLSQCLEASAPAHFKPKKRTENETLAQLSFLNHDPKPQARQPKLLSQLPPAYHRNPMKPLKKPRLFFSPIPFSGPCFGSLSPKTLKPCPLSHALKQSGGPDGGFEIEVCLWVSSWPQCSEFRLTHPRRGLEVGQSRHLNPKLQTVIQPCSSQVFFGPQLVIF